MQLKIRLALLACTWLLLSAGGPFHEGVEMGVRAGGGEFEGGYGCGARQRSRYAATQAFIRYRPEASAFTLSGEAGGFTSRIIARETGDPGSPVEYVNLIGEERLSARFRLGGQWKYAGFELGASAWGDRTYFLPMPTATLRVFPFERHAFEVTALDLPAHLPAALLALNYHYTAEKYRAGLGFRRGEEADLWGEFSYRVADHHSVGVELHYFADAVFGPMGAAFLQYRWHSRGLQPEAPVASAESPTE